MPLRVAAITSRGCAHPDRWGFGGNLVEMNGQQLAGRLLAIDLTADRRSFAPAGERSEGEDPILDGMSPAPRCLYSTGATIPALLSSALLLAACPGSAPTGDTSADGSSTGDAPQDPTTSSSGSSTGGPPDGSGDPAAFFVPGRDGDAAYVLRVSPATGEVTPYGPALPAAADQFGYFQDVLPSPDGSRVVVRVWLVPDGPVATLLVGDGSSWTVVTKYNKLGLGEDSLSPDASLMWFDEVVQDGDLYTYQARVITTAGEPVFEGPPRSPDESLDWDAFAPDGSWFSYVDPGRGLVLRTLGGAEAVLPGDNVHVAFPGSAVVLAYPELKWVDLQGKPLAVPGFAPAYENVWRTGYQVDGGALSLLGDAVVEPLQAVPIGTSPESVYGHAKGAFAVAVVGAGWGSIGVDGAVVSQFAPLPSPVVPDFGELETWITPAAGCLECATRSIVFHADNYVISGDQGLPADSSVQWWQLDAGGAATQPSLLRPWSEDGPLATDFHFSADGNFLVWVEGSALRRLDVQTAAIEPIDTPYTILR